MHQMLNYSLKPVLSLLLCVLMFGCGGDSNRARIFGKVTVDGEPLADGVIQFVPAQGTQGPTVQMQIQNGEYSSSNISKPTIGKNLVQITAMKKTGKSEKNIMGENVDQVVQFIPPKYNVDTELQADIQPKSNEFNYDISTDEPKK